MVETRNYIWFSDSDRKDKIERVLGCSGLALTLQQLIAQARVDTKRHPDRKEAKIVLTIRESQPCFSCHHRLSETLFDKLVS